MDEAQGSITGFFAKIRQQEDAAKVVRAASLVFLAVGAFLCIASIWSGFELWVHGLAYIVLGILLRQLRSRVIASLMLLVALVLLLPEMGLMPDRPYALAANIILAAVLAWVAIRAIEATSKLRARKAQPAPPESE